MLFLFTSLWLLSLWAVCQAKRPWLETPQKVFLLLFSVLKYQALLQLMMLPGSQWTTDFISTSPERLDDQFSSVTQSCPTLRDPMNRSTAGLPVHHQLPEFTQTHVHQVSDAIQPPHLLSSPSLPAPNPFQHQSLFQWVNSLHEVAKELEFQLHNHSLQRNPKEILQNGLVGCPCSPRDSQESSPTPQFKSINSSALSLLISAH